MPVVLPWGTADGEPRTVTVHLGTVNDDPISRPSFNANVWKPAIRAAGVEDPTRRAIDATFSHGPEHPDGRATDQTAVRAASAQLRQGYGITWR